ncbi:GNAT family N-acetyltransferase [Actinomadura vinacea]|uniref:GNAT family N-acetyltransferase n=1 Tax=Actinomadura vinacea TaxID=115336 RepID=A0ABN3KD55_9ACTN
MIDSRTGVPLEFGKVTLHELPYDHPAAIRLVRALFDDQVERYGYADPVEADPAHYAPPEGLFLVAYAGAVPVGCGGYRTHDAPSRTIEIKKMYSLPGLRGTGLGRRILAELERRAAAAGFTDSILETGIRNTAALALYTSTGYQPRPRYAVGYRDPEINRAFVKKLPHGE